MFSEYMVWISGAWLVHQKTAHPLVLLLYPSYRSEPFPVGLEDPLLCIVPVDGCGTPKVSKEPIAVVLDAVQERVLCARYVGLIIVCMRPESSPSPINHSA